MGPALRSRISALSRHKVTRNFLALASSQGLGYLIPLITFPYIVRVVGVELYGSLAFATALIAYFIILTDYGFTLSATRDIAEHNDDPGKVAEIFNAVMAIKLSLAAVCFAILLAGILFIDFLARDRMLYLVTFSTVIGMTLLPYWFFQGMQKMGFITLLDLTAKITFASLLFVFVRTPDDYLYVPGLTGLGLIVAGVAAIGIIRFHFQVPFFWPQWDHIRHQFSQGWPIFTSRLFLNLYTTSNTVLLGIFTTPAIVGQYAIAEKIVTLLKLLFDSASQALFPHLVGQWKTAQSAFYAQLRVFTLGFVGAASVLAALVSIFAHDVVTLIVGQTEPATTDLMLILLAGFVVAPLGGLYTNVLITTGKSTYFQKIMFLTALVNLALAVPAIMAYQATGLAATSVLVTFFIIFACLYGTDRKRIFHGK